MYVFKTLPYQHVFACYYCAAPVLQKIMDNQELIMQALPLIKVAVKQLFKPPTPSQASRGSNQLFKKGLLKFYGMTPQNGQVRIYAWETVCML